MKKVLIIDDLKAIEAVYFELRKHYEVEATTDTHEIIHRTRRFAPHLVIVNADLPDFDAHEFCQIVKHELGIPTIIIVEPNSSTTININSCKADGVITKPLHKEQMLKTIGNILL